MYEITLKKGGVDKEFKKDFINVEDNLLAVEHQVRQSAVFSDEKRRLDSKAHRKLNESYLQMFDDLVGSIEKLAQSKLDKNINLAKKLGLSEETINALKSKTESVVNNVKSMNTQIKAIMEKHNGDMSQLSSAEKELVLRNQREMIIAQLDLMKFSASEKKALTAALNNELDALNARQLEKVSENTVKMLDKENSAYKTKKAELKEILKQFGSDTSKLSAEELAARQEVLNRLTELNMQHNLKTKALKTSKRLA